MKALLVVDVDHGDGWWADSMTSPGEGRRKAVAVAIKNELAAWRKEGGLVVFIVLVGQIPEGAEVAQTGAVFDRPEECLVCGLSQSYRLAEFLEHRHGQKYEPCFIKADCNAFLNSELLSFLRERGVTEVVLMGCSTFACVLETAQGAAKRGLDVTLLQECVYPEFANPGYMPYARDRWTEAVRGVNPAVRVSIR